MKTSALAQSGTMVPSLFQIASYFEDFIAHATLKRPATEMRKMPFADLMLNPEKLVAALKSGKNEVFAAHSPAIQSPPKPAPTRSATPKKREGNSNGPDKPDGPLPGKVQKIEFHLEAPSAKSVKLAADFTDWDKFPLDMMRSKNGVWSSVIPLAPGHYSYRFIVDGQWCDDPRSMQRAPNPFGTENAVITVT